MNLLFVITTAMILTINNGALKVKQLFSHNTSKEKGLYWFSGRNKLRRTFKNGLLQVVQSHVNFIDTKFKICKNSCFSRIALTVSTLSVKHK